MNIKKLPGNIVYYLSRILDRCMMYAYRPLFNSYGKSFVFDTRGSLFSFKTISVGDDVYIGPGAKFIAKNSFIKIGNKVMFGPDVSIRGGNHNTSVIGKFMFDVHEKRTEDDLSVIIEDDVWVGTNVTILKGVRIGRGSVIAAGAVVNKDVPPYSIVGGVPSKFIKFRWNIEQIVEHEKKMYPDSEQISVDALENYLTKYTK